MKRISLPDTAHSIIREHLQSGDISIDATLGNGYDTLFLAQSVGAKGHVYGFDVQIQALQVTRQRLQQHNLEAMVTLFQASHANMTQHIPRSLHGKINTIMFNLGYLPGADKTLITQTKSTLQAIKEACQLLSAPGIITVMAYPGHVGGDEETRSLEQWLQQLDSTQFSLDIIYSGHHQDHAPRLFVIKKLA